MKILVGFTQENVVAGHECPAYRVKVGARSKTSTPIPTFPHREGEGDEKTQLPDKNIRPICLGGLKGPGPDRGRSLPRTM